jgi:class 3 adenylate cyclase
MQRNAAEIYTVVFADIVGSTRLYETVGDSLAQTLITDLEHKIAELVIPMGGVVQQFVGDEVVFYFADVNAAVDCACQVHETAEAFSEARGVPMMMRIGLHCGPVIIVQDRMFGDTVNTAARIVGIAQGGQIIASETVVNQLKEKLRAKARHFDETKVKGKQNKIVVYDLLWRPSNVTKILRPVVPASQHIPSLMLRYGQARYQFESGQRDFTIGRDRANDLVIMAATASRKHARIELGRDRFIYIDISTNGSYVQTQDGEPIYIRRETLPLWGRGRIALGAPLDEGDDHIVEFECD